MKISGNGDIKNEALLQYQQAGTTKSGTEKTAGSTGVNVEDRISISSQTRDINLAKSVIDSMPDVREDVVNSIKNSIDNGTYQVDHEKIAGKMVSDSVVDLYA